MNEALAVGIFAVTLIALFLEKWHRVTISAMGAIVMVGVGHALGFYDEEAAIEALEMETIGLLMGMMILVALLKETGFFSYIAIRVAQASGGNITRLILTLGITTSVLSMVLDNVTTVILMAPVVVLIAELIGVSPLPFLISQAIFSNTGGMATLVGDPPNILIGAAANIDFVSFLVHMFPIVLVAWLATYASLSFVFRGQLRTNHPVAVETLNHLNANEALHDPTNARRLLLILGLVIVGFFLQSTLDITPAFAALAGAAIALVWTKHDVPSVLEHMEWDVLLFFSALFIMVGGLEASGVLEDVAAELITLKSISPVLLGLIILWMMVVLSALVDNVPITIAFIPIVLELGQQGINIEPLWWAIALGAGLGGNATPIGATANVVVISLSERTDTPIHTEEWLRVGIPTVLVATLVTSAAYVALYPFLR